MKPFWFYPGRLVLAYDHSAKPKSKTDTKMRVAKILEIDNSGNTTLLNLEFVYSKRISKGHFASAVIEVR